MCEEDLRSGFSRKGYDINESLDNNRFSKKEIGQHIFHENNNKDNNDSNDDD